MDNFSQWIIYGLLIAVSYMFIGYHIAQLSREVRKNWDKQVLDVIATFPLKLILYPLVVDETARGRNPEWLLHHDYKYGRPAYVLFHLFLWPLRIAGNLVVLVLVYLGVPVVALLAALIFRMIVGGIESVAKKISSEAGS